jgi:hypothetical protein
MKVYRVQFSATPPILRLTMWYYNNIKRHFINAKIAFIWFKEKRTLVGMPQMGKVTEQSLSWANYINRK